ncbi:MAG: hypothetical protein ACYC6F_19120 [Longimicrobiales bacterium]
MKRMGVEHKADEPAEFPLVAAESKAGHTYYQWDLNGVPLPDGFATRIRVLGQDIQLSPVRESKNGNQMCDGRGQVRIGTVPHVASVTLVKTRKPYWIKVLVHVRPGGARRSVEA